ncbi:MAG: AbrB/MazE/SpoVT family DNA-binding domain-containing protein [Oscillospiraceae bacterium]|nr:AbrB/MazE/SpoVT family DNA-binding domain-containing protein [Oscillospiraceae bacterium]
MLTTIQKWGNSQAIRLPKAILDSLLLQESDQVYIVAEDDSIVIRKSSRRRRAKKSIDERLEAFYQKPINEIFADESLYAPAEYDWGKPMGKEVW